MHQTTDITHKQAGTATQPLIISRYDYLSGQEDLALALIPWRQPAIKNIGLVDLESNAMYSLGIYYLTGMKINFSKNANSIITIYRNTVTSIALPLITSFFDDPQLTLKQLLFMAHISSQASQGHAVSLDGKKLKYIRHIFDSMPEILRLSFEPHIFTKTMFNSTAGSSIILSNTLAEKLSMFTELPNAGKSFCHDLTEQQFIMLKKQIPLAKQTLREERIAIKNTQN